MMRCNSSAVYTPGTDLDVAAALSRNPLTNRYIDSLEEEFAAHIAAVEATVEDWFNTYLDYLQYVSSYTNV